MQRCASSDPVALLTMKKGFLLTGKKVSRAKKNESAGARKCPSQRDKPAGNQDQHDGQPLQMKKGFLLGASKASAPVDVISHAGSTSNLQGEPISRRDSMGGMKRGFLLADSSNQENINRTGHRNESRTLPQCSQGTISPGSPSHKNSVLAGRRKTASTAFLDFENASCEHDGNAVGGNRQYTRTVSSLLHVIEDEPDDGREGSQSGCAHGNDLVQGGGNQIRQTIDDWIQPSKSEPSLFLPSSNVTGSGRKCPSSKASRPLIVEVEHPPEAEFEESAKSSSSDKSVHGDATNNALNGIGEGKGKGLTLKDTHESVGMVKTQSMGPPKVCPTLGDSVGKCPGAESVGTNAISQKDLLHFSNEVSLLLAQLRRTHKSKNHGNGESSHEDLVVGVSALLNQQSHSLIKSFVTKYWSDQSEKKISGHSYMDNLLQMILEPIAQNSIDSVQSRKRRKHQPRMICSPLALGLGAIEGIRPVGVAYESIVAILSKAVVNPNGSSHIPCDDMEGDIPESISRVNENQRRRLKTLALGAVQLVRCRIRCLAITITSMENWAETSSDPHYEHVLKSTEQEIGILMSKILPALDKILSSACESRTILMTAAADACFELIETSSRAAVLLTVLGIQKGIHCSLSPELIQVWRSTLPIIERLLSIKRCWVSKSDKPNQLRVKCIVAVLDDWMDLIKRAKHLFFDRSWGDDLLDGQADVAAVLNLFWNFSGIPLIRAENESSAKVIFRVGGIGQSLCQQQECPFGSPIVGSLHDLGGAVETGDIISLVQESAKLTDSIRTANKMGRVSKAQTKEHQQRAAVRAFASWLGRSKAIQTLTKSTKRGNDADFRDIAVSSLLALLRSESKHCVNLSVATLSLLWSGSSDWVQQDVRSGETVPPRPFSDLLDALHLHSSQFAHNEEGTEIDPTSKALCILTASIASRKPALLLPCILKMNGREEIKIEVVLNMLEEQHPSSIDSANVVYRAASKLLLEDIESVSYLRSRINSNPSLFSQVPCEIIIPPILEYFLCQYAQKRSPPSVSSLSRLLCSKMKEETTRGHANDFAECVVKHLRAIEEKGFSQADSPAESKTLTMTFFAKNGPLWKRTLLGASTLSDCAYKDLLLAAAKSMIEMPSSGIPLAFLASLVDNEVRLEQPASVDLSERRALTATLGVIQFAMHQISDSHQNDIINEDTIFGRLAPLLILRRLPQSYYRVLHKELLSLNETNASMSDLASFLSKALRMHALKTDQSNLVKEEKKLLAELAGHCLPFSISSVSLFESICREPLSDTLKALRCGQLNHIPCFNEAKAAIYATSYALQFASDDEDGKALLNVAYFVFEVLKDQPGLEIMEPERSGREFLMLQSGCTHFLSVCLDSLARRKMRDVEGIQPRPLIEVKCPGAYQHVNNKNSCSFLEVLSKTFHWIQSAMTRGEIIWKGFPHECFTIPQHDTGGGHKLIQFSPSSRTSMFNAIVILAQGSIADDNRLEWLASSTVPVLVDWACTGSIDDNIYHPICVAAALQAVYTLLARCGFGWMSNNCLPNTKYLSQENLVCRTLQCALKSFHAVGGGSSSLSTLRLAALKVILTIIALNQANEVASERCLKRYLTTTEMKQAMSALHGAANVDQNSEVRRLASEIIPYLVTGTQ